jgi:hypothetical protein
MVEPTTHIDIANPPEVARKILRRRVPAAIEMQKYGANPAYTLKLSLALPHDPRNA